MDCETTGLDPRVDQIIQLAIVRVEAGVMQDRWSTMVRPEGPVPLVVQRLTGIDQERLHAAPVPPQALAEWRDLVGTRPLVGHNIAFDLSFLHAGLRRHGLEALPGEVYDTLELARILTPFVPSHRLADMAAHWDIPLRQAHDALADAETAAQLFLVLQNELFRLSPELRATLARILGEGPLGSLLPPSDGIATLLRPVRREDPPRADLAHATDIAQLMDALRPDSPLGQQLSAFEPRPGQRMLLEAVWRAFSSDRHLLAEAGTGTGKTLAYLLPALAWSSASGGQRVVIATHTVNLQEQLMHKDLPLATAGLGGGEVALLKGRGQYLCWKLWSERLAEREFDSDEQGLLARIAVWLQSTTTGDRTELGLYGADEERFTALSTETVACTGRRCPFYDGCFLFEARRKAERADVVVVNHALLLSDLARGGGVVPAYQYVIFDEAHHVETDASTHLGYVVGSRALERFFRQLGTPGNGPREHGLLPGLRGVLQGLRIGEDAAWATRGLGRLREAEAILATSAQAADLCFRALSRWAVTHCPGEVAGRWTARFGSERSADADWTLVEREGDELERGLRALASALDDLAEVLEEGEEQVLGEGDRSAAVRSLAVKGREAADGLEVCLGGRDGWVGWCEVHAFHGLPGASVLYAVPINPGKILAELLFAPKRSVVLTSATLTVRKSFAFVQKRLGILEGPESERTNTLVIGSPFDYRHQALLALSTSGQGPQSRAADQIAEDLAPWVVRLSAITRGQTLVLLTSNRVLRELRERVRGPLEQMGIVCLAQGADGSRTTLANALRRNEETVVLGASSFWEGVDLPGDALRLLLIAQLPFWPPDIPLLQARLEEIERRGGNGFAELQLPAAVLRFKQGFGRLIRTGSDHGAVVVLDPRLATARYGSVFVDSLPGPQVLRTTREEIVERLAQWFSAKAVATPPV